MTARSLELAALALVSAAVALAACGTKVVTLDRSCNDAAAPFPVPFCLAYSGAGETICKACYDRCGVELADTCGPVRAGACHARPDITLVRCVHCADATGLDQQVACLSCNPPGGDGCAACRWTDGVGGQCLRCVDAAGSVASDDCDLKRPELP